MANKPKTKPLRPEEEEARQRIAAYLRETVEPHDNLPTQRGRPDLRIEYRDQPHAVVEVVRDVDRQRAQHQVEADRVASKAGECATSTSTSKRSRSRWSIISRAGSAELPPVHGAPGGAGPGTGMRPVQPPADRLADPTIRQLCLAVSEPSQDYLDS
jgi:hypothetical protein